MGGKIDTQINRMCGPYVFRLSGNNYHRIGSLLPSEGNPAKFLQLYVIDSGDEVSSRKRVFQDDGDASRIDNKIIKGLISMLDRVIVVARVFRSARDRFTESDLQPVRVWLLGRRDGQGKQYNEPTADEIAIVIVGDITERNFERDVIVQHRSSTLEQISDLHPSFMAQQCPFLLPYGEDEYHPEIPYILNEGKNKTKRTSVTMREYYSYILQFRPTQGKTIFYGGNLFQQMVVDAYCAIEAERLRYLRLNQKKFRSDLYSNICDTVTRGDVTADTVGKRTILPSSGGPDLIGHISGQQPNERPDIETHVFKIKLDQLIRDITVGEHFGPTIGVVYTMEFQKRGLPHVHILLWLDGKSKLDTPTMVNQYISVEIPGKETDAQCYEAVRQFMVHGPCGDTMNSARCLKYGKCTKKFPERFNSETTIDEDGFPCYRRRDNGNHIEKRSSQLDNRFVVPYNREFILKYNSHINGELCNKSRAIKHLFKYMHQGPDRTIVVIQENVVNDETTNQKSIIQVNEIENYLDCRYIAPCEAAWRIFGYTIHRQQPAILKMVFHLPNEHLISF